MLKSLRAACGPSSACVVFMAGGLALSALIGTGCEGTSSGVDNPGVAELTVSFRDADGAALRVTGDLDVFSKDQNPALDPEPLATVRVKGSSLTNLTSEDFQRINTGRGTAAAAKRAAASPAASPAPADTPVAFNLVFRSDAKTGSLAFGLVYDPKSKTFIRRGARLSRLDIQPQELIRYQARLSRVAAVHGDLGRVFIPGTPFQATLADSGFVFEAIPAGVFDLRLLGRDGRIFAVKESLDTRTTLVFTTDSVPVGRIDTTQTPDKPVRFTVGAFGPVEAFIGHPAVLEGKIAGADSAGAPASVLWRVLRDLSPDSAKIANPFALSTQILFRKGGVYSVELAVTIGVRTARDTAVIGVRESVPPRAGKVVTPVPGDSVFAGQAIKITWEMPARGRVDIQLSTTAGREAWQTLADSLPGEATLNYHPWTVPDSLANRHECLIRVKHSGSDSLVAQMAGPFSVLSKPVRVPVDSGKN